jgi:HK97 gp10 family phage protein
MMMRTGISATVSMDHNFVNFLHKNEKIGKDVIEVVKRNGASMQNLAMKKAPVDTGFLKRHIHLNFTVTLTDFVAVVSGDAEYDAYQEYGTRFQPGTPHLRPALYETEDTFVSEMERLVSDHR